MKVKELIEKLQQFDPELGELASRAAEALVTGRLLQGYQIEPVPLLLLNHTGRFDHEGVGAGSEL